MRWHTVNRRRRREAQRWAMNIASVRRLLRDYLKSHGGVVEIVAVGEPITDEGGTLQIVLTAGSLTSPLLKLPESEKQQTR
jgi:hypothetical protein